MSKPPVQPDVKLDVKSAKPEPKLKEAFRFEVGEAHDLIEHIKEWVEWRLGQVPPAK